MRCWYPRADEVIKNVQLYGPEEIILMPLYPQYSAATSGSSIEEWFKICEENNFKINTKIICCYPTEDNFIHSHVKLIKERLSLNNLSETKIILSAHGLPENKIKKGDPYQWQVEKTVEKLINKLKAEPEPFC